MKRLMFILVTLCLMAQYSWAVEFNPYQPTETAIQGYNPDALNAQAPSFQFNGTSMQTGSYTIPVAVLNYDDATHAYVATNPGRNIHRVIIDGDDDDMPGGGSGGDPANPTTDTPLPVGDTPWLFFAFMALAYAAMRIYRLRKS